MSVNVKTVTFDPKPEKKTLSLVKTVEEQQAEKLAYNMYMLEHNYGIRNNHLVK